MRWCRCCWWDRRRCIAATQDLQRARKLSDLILEFSECRSRPAALLLEREALFVVLCLSKLRLAQFEPFRDRLAVIEQAGELRVGVVLLFCASVASDTG